MYKTKTICSLARKGQVIMGQLVMYRTKIGGPLWAQWWESNYVMIMGQLVMYRMTIMGPMVRKELVMLDQPVIYRIKIMGPTVRKGLVIMGQPVI